MRRSGQQDNNALAPIELAAQPLSRCGSIRIGKHHRSLEHVRLLGIVGGHFPAARRETPLNAGKHIFITPQRNTESFGHCFPGKVIFGGSETAAENHDLRTKQRMLRGRNQALEIIADHALENYFNAQLIDLLGEIERVRIHAEGRE